MLRILICPMLSYLILTSESAAGYLLSYYIFVVAGLTDIPFALREHMLAVNRIIIAGLEELGVKNLSIRGISDITIKDRKILGASLHKSKNTVLYQGSLLVDPDMDLIERYLKHPKKEPDYRGRRSHKQFLTSLSIEGRVAGIDDVISVLERRFSAGPPWKNLYRDTDGRTKVRSN